MNIYKDLEIIVADHIGYRECGIDYDDETGQAFPNYECADPVAYDNIIDELTKLKDGHMPFKYCSEDTQFCWNKWREELRQQEEYSNQFKLKGQKC